MKSVFFCNKPKIIKSVFDEESMNRAKDLFGIDDTIYTKRMIMESPEIFQDTEYIFSSWGMPVFTAKELKDLFPSLKCIFYAAGTVQKFARPFLKKGVRIFSAWAANAVPVAEFTVAEIILAGKGFFPQSRLMSIGKQEKARRDMVKYIGNYKQKVGLIGCGMIGSLVAEFLKQYSLEVLVYDPYISDEKLSALGAKRASLEEIFSSCRVISNHLPNHKETRKMFDEKLFSMMLPNSSFINTARGNQVNEDDLVRILKKRRDITALLDVTYPEPARADHPFFSLPNCYVTPHIAGSRAGEVSRMAEYIMNEAECYIKNEPCKYEVTLEMLKTMA